MTFQPDIQYLKDSAVLKWEGCFIPKVTTVESQMNISQIESLSGPELPFLWCKYAKCGEFGISMPSIEKDGTRVQFFVCSPQLTLFSQPSLHHYSQLKPPTCSRLQCGQSCAVSRPQAGLHREPCLYHPSSIPLFTPAHSWVAITVSHKQAILSKNELI